MILSPEAEQDIRDVLKRSRERLGVSAEVRYRGLLKQGLRDLAADPERPGSAERSELGRGVRSYHLWFSRERARAGGETVRGPRHFLIYRVRNAATLDVIRVLHDSRELRLHVPGDAG
ncbi:MAG: type II toxin-antitoxin system RelE/ParE family toxin [Acidobacteria bacterium]|nr:type II toxin-antitoxin system RelE/ParE family toxin [Acidobacteriota bacterium]